MGIPTNNPSNENKPREGGIRGQIPQQHQGNPQNRNNPAQSGQGGNIPRQGIPRQNPNAPQGSPQGTRPPQNNQQSNQQGNPGLRQAAANQGTRIPTGNNSSGEQSRQNRIPVQRPENTNQESGGSRIPRQQPPSLPRQKPADPPARPIQQPRVPVINTFDEPEDDTFSTIEEDFPENNQFNDSFDEIEFVDFEQAEPIIDENNSMDDFGLEDIGFVEEQQPEPQQQSRIKKKSNAEANRAIDKPKNVDESGQNSFIDSSNRQIEPFGGDLSKKKIKEEQFDKRVNIRRKASIVQTVIIGLVVVLVGLGVKNAVFPPDSLSVDEVAGIAAEISGLTNFPLEGGKGYVTDFMKAFLTVDSSNPDQQKILNYFFNGSETADALDVSRNTSGNYGQDIVSGPTIYEATALSDYSANYIIGAVVKPYNVLNDGKREYLDPKVEYFSVNVYYDEKNKQYSIPRDSPTVIPELAFTNPDNLPVAATFGTGEKDEAVSEEVKSLVVEFMKGYAISSDNDYSALKQYIKSTDEVDLETGLNGKYTFESNSPEDAIEYTVFANDPEVPSNEHKVIVNVQWERATGEGETKAGITYSSQYVMTIKKQGDRFLVTKFAPFYFLRDDKAFVEFDKNRENSKTETKKEKVVEEEITE